MKKVLYFMTMVLALTLTSCSKDEPGGTETQSMAGEWYVTVDAIDASGNVVDAWQVDPVIIRTFNTSSNSSTKMYISDCSRFSYGIDYAGYNGYWEIFGFYMPIDVNLVNGTFSTPADAKNLMPNYAYDDYGYEQYSTISITNGKIIENGGVQKNGSPAASIEFDIKVANDYTDRCYATTDAGYYAENGIDHFHVKGVRYSGLVNNE